MKTANAGTTAAAGPDETTRRARASVWRAIEIGAADYQRERHLPRLLPLMPREIGDESIAARRRIVARLMRALRAERTRGRAGHWTYDLNRHIALNQAYVAERRMLAAATKSGRGAAAW